MHKGSWGAFAADLIGQETDYMYFGAINTATVGML